MRGIRIAAACLLVAGLAACERDRDAAQEEAAGSRGATEAGGASAVAVSDGTTRDWCSEHGVAESQCTRCNPSLIAAFQERGDWCGEHGLPESQCTICNPGLAAGAPAAPGAAPQPAPRAAPAGDEAPADGTKIRFATPETAEKAGIRVVAASERASDARVEAVARIVYDATRVARLNARAPGVVRAIRGDVGSRVRVGEAVVEIESAAVGSDQSRLQAAEARLRVARAQQARAQALFEGGIIPAQEADLSRLELEAATAEHAAAQQALHVVDTSGGPGFYVLASPLSGLVTERHATVGQHVDPEEPLFEIVDPTSVWAEIDVRESDLASVAPGQEVVLHIDALPDRELRAAIDYVAPAVDPRTRTARARVRLANPAGDLRANMYGTAHIQVGDGRPAVRVPRGAVQQVAGVPLAFVRLSDDLYETRRVRLGSRTGGHVEILHGVREGEAVVTDGAFLLKTETMRGSIGAGCCEPAPPR